MRSFNNIMSTVSKDGALAAKTKELMTISIAISTKCEGCILFHLNKALKLGIIREEILETIAVAVEMVADLQRFMERKRYECLMN